MLQLINKSRYTLNLVAKGKTADEEVERAVQVLIPSGQRADISAADWSVLEQHAGIQGWRRMGWLVLARPRKPAPAPPPVEVDEEEVDSDLGSLNAKEAIELVAVTIDVEELHAMLDDETRKSVRRAIEERLKELSASA